MTRRSARVRRPPAPDRRTPEERERDAAMARELREAGWTYAGHDWWSPPGETTTHTLAEAHGRLAQACAGPFIPF
jgi:hypothetical protein